ncbi:hypothetical protein [Arthrobacter sp. A5]|uniref:hypothetical protein n=1 Tax=Arthrobacter sp. A5 TaxID=576926 RepID=UPI003DA7F166
MSAPADGQDPCALREPGGGIVMDVVRVAKDPRVLLVGYGASASTMGHAGRPGYGSGCGASGGSGTAAAGAWHLNAAVRPGGLRWGMEFSDGRRGKALDESPWNSYDRHEAPLEPPVSTPVIDGMGRPVPYADTWTREFGIWPLPTAGRLRFVCAWPDRASWKRRRPWTPI